MLHIFVLIYSFFLFDLHAQSTVSHLNGLAVILPMASMSYISPFAYFKAPNMQQNLNPKGCNKVGGLTLGKYYGQQT